MKLAYTDLGGKRHTVKAKITTDHPDSSHGIPVIVLPDGGGLDYSSAAMLNYQVLSATPAEQQLLKEWRRAMPPLG